MLGCCILLVSSDNNGEVISEYDETQSNPSLSDSEYTAFSSETSLRSVDADTKNADVRNVEQSLPVLVKGSRSRSAKPLLQARSASPLRPGLFPGREGSSQSYSSFQTTNNMRSSSVQTVGSLNAP